MSHVKSHASHISPPKRSEADLVVADPADPAADPGLPTQVVRVEARLTSRSGALEAMEGLLFLLSHQPILIIS